jgi:Family of unknown function (DUF5681)
MNDKKSQIAGGSACNPRRAEPAAAPQPLQEGQSGNPGGRRTKSLPALLAAALNETVVVTIDGRRRKLTKREAIVTQMVDKSASADQRATKMLIDMMKDVGHKAVNAAPPPEPRRLVSRTSYR